MKPVLKSSLKTIACSTALVPCLVAEGFAAPQISSVTQKTDGGESQLVISGSGFGNKPHPRPLYYFDFEDNSREQNSSFSMTSESLSTDGELVSETTPFGSGNVLRFTIRQSSSAVAIPRIEFDSDQLYVYFNRRYSFSIDDSSTWGSIGFNLKTNRLWGDSGNNIYIGYQGKEGTSSGRIYPEYTAEGGATWVGSDLAQLEDQWTQEEIVYQASDVGEQNGRFDIIRNGNSVHDSNFRMRTSSYPDRYSQLYFDQISNGTNANQTLYIYYDNIYVDDSFHRVYLSDASSFSDAKNRIIQIPTDWSDSNVVVNINPGDFDLSSAYVYVVDGNGDANSNGVRVCADDCPSPPNPPARIDIQ
ncbi:hypothetical protein [Marinobacter bohaiensis]|uniref:hypothetical protein n=1 Tax=Marinobacter bohaiensis TaxID=2201898 RepID=UPI0013A6C271|nr:hypothetical protein [Marinobacter bohaiensis]